MKGKNGLYFKVNTNNYAHLVISVDEATNLTDAHAVNSEQINNKVTFSLEDDDKLVL